MVIKQKTYIPDRGDIIQISFTPQSGREQAGTRPALVISPIPYNRRSHFILACPITSRIKGWGFEVILPTSMTTYGVVLADQISTLDWRSRQGKFIEKSPVELILEVLAKIAPLVSVETNN